MNAAAFLGKLGRRNMGHSSVLLAALRIALLGVPAEGFTYCPFSRPTTCYPDRHWLAYLLQHSLLPAEPIPLSYHPDTDSPVVTPPHLPRYCCPSLELIPDGDPKTRIVNLTTRLAHTTIYYQAFVTSRYCCCLA